PEDCLWLKSVAQIVRQLSTVTLHSNALRGSTQRPQRDAKNLTAGRLAGRRAASGTDCYPVRGGEYRGRRSDHLERAPCHRPRPFAVVRGTAAARPVPSVRAPECVCSAPL